MVSGATTVVSWNTGNAKSAQINGRNVSLQGTENVPVEKYQKEERLLMNGLYPDKKLQPGMLYKVVE